MAKEKVTIQDIADALGLSRTTVSKVLNKAPNMPVKTINSVLKKAKEMNYKHFSYLQDMDMAINNKKGGTFALLANFLPERFHIASSIMASLEHEISKYGYSLTIHMINPSDIQSLRLPQNFKPEQIDAILGIEIFDESYSRMLCQLGKPVLFFDSYYNPQKEPLDANILLMESQNSTYRMLSNVFSSSQIKHTGFIGDFNHCISFRERYHGYLHALHSYHMPYEESYCITMDDALFQQTDFIEVQLKKMKSLPELFFCANDLLAWKTISALKTMNLEVPKDIKICGFDDTLVLNSIHSTLTTVTTPSIEMGVMAARILLDRIENKELPITTIYIDSEVQIRESTVVY